MCRRSFVIKVGMLSFFCNQSRCVVVILSSQPCRLEQKYSPYSHDRYSAKLKINEILTLNLGGDFYGSANVHSLRDKDRWCEISANMAQKPTLPKGWFLDTIDDKIYY